MKKTVFATVTGMVQFTFRVGLVRGLALISSFNNSIVYAEQAISGAVKPQVTAEGADNKDGGVQGEFKWSPPPQKNFSAKEKSAECKKYEGQFIGYYGSVFKVESCRRRELVQSDAISAVTARGIKIIPVDGDTIIKIPAGRELSTRHLTNERGCKQLEGHYVVNGASDIYFIESCKKRLFPDWETYREHKQKKKLEKMEILELSEFEFNRLPSAEPYVSVLDDEYKRLLGANDQMEIIPLDEACRGIDGQFVTYYSKIYKIERCYKREVSGNSMSVLKLPKKQLPELSSEQWLSLPNGKPYQLKVQRK